MKPRLVSGGGRRLPRDPAPPDFRAVRRPSLSGPNAAPNMRARFAIEFEDTLEGCITIEGLGCTHVDIAVGVADIGGINCWEFTTAGFD